MLCCGTMSHVHSALSKDKDGVGLVFDKLTPGEFQPMLDDLPPDVAARVIYVQEDISKWSYNTFKNLVRKHLDLSVSQLASVHGSPPCTTWSRAHHGKNPHRQRGKGRNLLPRTELARQMDGFDWTAGVSLTQLRVREMEPEACGAQHFAAVPAMGSKSSKRLRLPPFRGLRPSQESRSFSSWLRLCPTVVYRSNRSDPDGRPAPAHWRHGMVRNAA